MDKSKALTILYDIKSMIETKVNIYNKFSNDKQEFEKYCEKTSVNISETIGNNHYPACSDCLYTIINNKNYKFVDVSFKKITPENYYEKIKSKRNDYINSDKKVKKVIEKIEKINSDILSRKEKLNELEKEYKKKDMELDEKVNKLYLENNINLFCDLDCINEQIKLIENSNDEDNVIELIKNINSKHLSN